MKRNSRTEFLLLIIVAVAVLGSCFIQKKFYENYEGMNISLLPGSYPSSDNVPILVRDYPLKNPIKLNAHTTNLWKDYPVFDSSYAQRTNNVEYWKNPDNGMCSPLEFCNTMYKNKKLHIPPQPKAISLDSNAIRVNYYASKK